MNSLNNNIISCNNSLAYRNLRRSPKCKSTRYRSGDYAPSPNALPSKNTLHQAPIVVSYNTALSWFMITNNLIDSVLHLYQCVASTIRLSRWQRRRLRCKCRRRKRRVVTTSSRYSSSYSILTTATTTSNQKWCIIFHRCIEYITDTFFTLVGEHVPCGDNGSVLCANVGCERGHSIHIYWMVTSERERSGRMVVLAHRMPHMFNKLCHAMNTYRLPHSASRAARTSE